MSDIEKNIIISPNIGVANTAPEIDFISADASSNAKTIALKVYPTSNGTLSFEGNTGQLFSITDSMSGTIYSVNDVSGIPSIEVLDTGLIKFAQYSGNVLLGTGTDNGTKLQVNGYSSYSNDIKTLGLVRATGWYNSPTGTDYNGLACEIGVFSGQTRVQSYNRTGAAFGTMLLSATYTEASGSLRSPLFYDLDNTAYYLDPASTSRLNYMKTGPSIPYAGGEGVFSDDRMTLAVGSAGLGSIVYQSQYNSASLPDYGLVFIHGASGGNRNVWSISPDGPAKGDLLGFLYTLNSTNIHTGTYRFWLDGSGNSYSQTSSKAPIFYDSNNTAYYIDPNSISNILNLTLNGTQYFPSGGGGATFSSNHYSMGKDVANGSWSHPHYADLIIGYHTGIRLGASYSGIRFYNNSPTTDANNDGNGDGGETLLMTIGGHAGGTGVIVNNTLTAGADVRAPLFYDSNNTAYYFDGASTTNINALTTAGNVTVGGMIYPRSVNSTSTDSASNIEVRNGGGTGDAALAAISFHCTGAYASKIHLRADGVFGYGGWSAGAWRWYVDGSGNMTAAGNVTAYSDPRLKEDINIIEDPIEKISKLNGVKFKWKDISELGNPGTYDYGILSSDVEKIAPELVIDSVLESPDGDRYKTVAYDKLVPFLIEAVKEQQKQIKHLEEKIDYIIKSINSS